MRNNIKISGLGLNWSKEYAYTYKDILFEVGFIASVIEYLDTFYVAYSHKSFAKQDAELLLCDLMDGETNDEYKESDEN